MVKIKHIVRYFVKNYPYENELSKTRITKMVYLADWYSALKHGHQLTDIKWFFDHYGPYVSDVFNAVAEDRHLTIKHDYNAFGNPKDVVALKKSHHVFDSPPIRIDNHYKVVLDEVIEDTQQLNWNEFIDYVYSSYPIKSSIRYHYLDLVNLGRECKDKGLNF
ncbi:Panacea domain-containing protein [Lysinibacillus sp. SGAir0095]|uniref:Panacea domain-containing protein n=1 Tax=Lysinibacillus sp. SGAir0095 TaxID=2070463 RepID=UPI00143CF1C9|nr:Panacea domain-containing protein [Lysinibacillus sp. SGAir0095]